MVRPFIIIGLLVSNALWLAMGYAPNTFAMLWIGYAIGILFMRAPHPSAGSTTKAEG